ncbi:MAG: hypothetical protein ACRDE2_15805, partial [Chitinophagaceae bacterium]
MRSRSILPIILIIVFLLDLYVFQAVKTVISRLQPHWRLGILIAYWIIAIACWILVLTIPNWHIT